MATDEQAPFALGSLANVLLPDWLSPSVQAVEPQRFEALVEALMGEWAAAPEGASLPRRSCVASHSSSHSSSRRGTRGGQLEVGGARCDHR